MFCFFLNIGCFFVEYYLHVVKLQQENKANRTILAITDFSPSSTNAILFAAYLFQYSAFNILLLNVFETPSDKDSLLISVDDILIKESDTRLKKQSAEIASILKDQKLNISTYSFPGKLKKGIAKVMETEDIDMIVSGIPSDKYPSKYLDSCPMLFMGQSKYPVLLVPEHCVDKPLRKVLTLNFDSVKEPNILNKDLEHIVNHDHITKYTLSINENKIDSKAIASLRTMLKKEEVELIIFIPAPGDRIDRALIDYQVQELSPAVSSILSY